jgi:hypothetical protein
MISPKETVKKPKNVFDGYTKAPVDIKIDDTRAMARQRMLFLQSVMRGERKDCLAVHDIEADRYAFLCGAVLFGHDEKWRSMEQIVLHARLVSEPEVDLGEPTFDPVNIDETFVWQTCPLHPSHTVDAHFDVVKRTSRWKYNSHVRTIQNTILRKVKDLETLMLKISQWDPRFAPGGECAARKSWLSSSSGPKQQHGKRGQAPARSVGTT